MAHRLKAIAIVVPILLGATPQRGRAPAAELPYDLAFGMTGFLFDTEFSVSSNGRFVIYDARLAPADTNLDDRYQPNGTPSSSVGSKVYITDLATKRSTQICPGGSCWRPVWSPDGGSVAFYSDADGQARVWVYDVAAARARRVSDRVVKPRLWHGDEPRWSPDNTTLYVGFAPDGKYRSPVKPKAARVPNAEHVVVLRAGSEAASAPAEAAPPAPMADHFAREHVVSLEAVDVRTGRSRILVPSTSAAHAGTVRRSASGKWLGVLSAMRLESDTSQEALMDLSVVPTAGGDPISVVKNTHITQYDYFGLEYVWHPAEDRLVFFDEKRMRLLDLRDGRPSAPVTLAPQLGDVAPTIFAFTRDGKSAVMGVDVIDDKGYGDPRPRAIAVVPLDGGTPVTVPIDTLKWTYSQLLKADERTAWQPDGASITLLLTDKATGERAIVRYDLSTKAERVLWKGRAKISNFTSGGRHDFILGEYEDLRTPSNLYKFSADFSTKERLSHLDPRLDEITVGDAEFFDTTIPLYDGKLTTVRTAVLLPAGAKKGDKLPAIVTMYPGSDVSRAASDFGGGDVFTVPNLVFTSRGYAVVLCNLSLGPNREAGNPAQEMTDVLLPQVYHAAELGYVDVNRLAITGQSYGGYGTASIITRTNLFRAAVPISGLYDLFGLYGKVDIEGGGFFLSWSEQGQGRMGTHPWANVRRYLENSPYYNADKIFTPVLIVHGTADDAYSDAGKLFAALRRLGRPAQLASYEGQGHVIYEWNRASAIDAARRMVDFYRAHLGDPNEATKKASSP